MELSMKILLEMLKSIKTQQLILSSISSSSKQIEIPNPYFSPAPHPPLSLSFLVAHRLTSISHTFFLVFDVLDSFQLMVFFFCLF
jgi:hypothetical protein